MGSADNDGAVLTMGSADNDGAAPMMGNADYDGQHWRWAMPTIGSTNDGQH